MPKTDQQKRHGLG